MTQALTIVMMRHGKPLLDLEAGDGERMTAAQVGQVVSEYEKTELDALSVPPKASMDAANGCSWSICSDLPRAVSSIEALGLRNISTIDPLYRESAMPFIKSHFPRMTFFSWAVLFRIAWLVGFSRHGESIREAKIRAKRAADKLESLSEAHGSVLNLGHGIMNRLIIKELKLRGWQVRVRTGEKYWSYTVLEN